MATNFSRGGRNTATVELGMLYQNDDNSNPDKNQPYENSFDTQKQNEQKGLDSSDFPENIHEAELNEEYNYHTNINRDNKKEAEVPKQKQQEKKEFNIPQSKPEEYGDFSQENGKEDLEPRYVEPMRFVDDSNYHPKDEKIIFPNREEKTERSIFPSEKKEEKRAEFMENRFVNTIRLDMSTMEDRDAGREDLDRLRNSSVLFKNLGPQEIEMVYKMKSLKMG